MFTVNVQLTKRNVLVLSILYFSISLWQYLFLINLTFHFGNEKIYSVFYLSLAFSMFLNKFLEEKSKLSLIFIWSLLTIGSTVFLILPISFVFVLVIVCILGALYSISLFAFFSYFCDLTSIGERGRVGGFLSFIPLLVFPVLTVLTSFFGFFGAMVLCIILNISVFLVLALKPSTKNEKKSEPQIFSRGTFFLYLIPWVIFAVINGTSAQVVVYSIYQRFQEAFLSLVIGQKLAAAIGALLAGMMADWVGRRLTLMLGLTLYGFATIFSAFSNVLEIVFLSSIVSGLSWGFFLVLYFLVVWGDLATGRSRFTCYISGFPFFLITGLGYALIPLLMGIPVEIVTLISVSFILLSNIPLIFAKELLPKAIRDEMELKRFLEWAKKKAK